MAIKVYIGQEKETLYDMAIKLYNDARGVSDILRLNPTIDLNAATYFGTGISYDDSIIYRKEVTIAEPPIEIRPDWAVQVGQSVYDLALQIYGDLDRLADIVKQLSNIDINVPVPFGTTIEQETTNNYLAKTLFSQKIVATSLPVLAYDSFIITETSFYILTEDGYRIPIE